jgi:hypothetical protein
VINQPPLVLLCSQNPIDIVEQMIFWLSEQSDVHLDVESIGRISSYALIKSGVGVILTVEPFATHLDGLIPIFYQSASCQPQSQICLSLDPRVAGGLRVPAVVKQFLSVAETLGSKMQALAAIWVPADVISGFEYFAEIVCRFVAGGPFPALSLVGFATDAKGCVNTQGMELFVGQEFRLTSESLDHNAKMQRMVRILHDLVLNGAISQPMNEKGLVAGEQVSIVPSALDGNLDVSIFSKMA